MAFHPYPQVIPSVFNRSGFGPPRGLTPASACPWIAHPASRLQHATKNAILKTRFRFGSLPSLTSPHTATRWLILQKARRHIDMMLRLLVGARFQALFHSPPGVLFTFPSRYWFAIGHRRVFSLGGWSPQLRTGFHVSGPTREIHSRGERFRVRGSHPLRPAFPCRSATSLLCDRAGLTGRPVMAPATPTQQRPALTRAWVWADPLSLAATRGISVDFSSSGYLDVSVPPVVLSRPISFRRGYTGMTPCGFPHSETSGSKGACPSPEIIAACRVLRRLPMPRHPPCALGILFTNKGVRRKYLSSWYLMFKTYVLRSYS